MRGYKSLCDLRGLPALGVVVNEPWKTGLFAFARRRLVVNPTWEESLGVEGHAKNLYN